MKKAILIALSALLCSMAFAQAPSWVKSRPVVQGKYVGIGMAPTSEADFQQIARNNALLEIATQIGVKVESSSFMQTVDVDGRSKSLFEEKVRESVADHLEGQELKDSYNDGGRYYVYYELDIRKYEKAKRERQKRGISLGMDYYTKGKAAEQMKNYTGAMQMYAKGLEAIEPYLYLSLVTEYEGRSFDVATELFNAYINVFSGFELIQNVTEVGAEAFKACGEPLTVCLIKKGEVMSNVLLRAEFVSGEGELTAPVKTDSEGVATFYITNLTSKQSIQAVQVSVDDSFKQALPKSYQALIENLNWPSARFNVVLMNPNYTAYLMVEGNDLEGCERQVRSILANNYFEFTEDTQAKLFITLSTKLDVGSVFKGELYDMNECYASLSLRIFDNVNQTQLADYQLNSIKVLVPADKSEAQAKAMCTRELMKRVNIELPKVLKKLNIN